MESLNQINHLTTEAVGVLHRAREAEAQTELLAQALLEEQARAARLERELEARTLFDYQVYNGG